MQSKATTVDQYLAELPDDRQEPMSKLHQVVLENIGPGTELQMNYGMIGYVIPHSKYPDGYHCNPKDPLPFINLGSQKNFIALYHCGIYAHEGLMEWFVGEYPKYVKSKLDMGKSCIRFKKMDQIPYPLIAELIAKMNADDWIDIYEANIKKK